MKKINKTGFTIVETMIVLGISGVLFASVVALMSGQQSRARFKSSTTDMVTRFQSTANEAASGYYPSNNNLKCTVVGSDLRLEQSATTQGSNNDCIYLGRAIMFGPVSGDNIQEYYIQTLVGKRRFETKEVQSFVAAGVRAVAPPNTVGSYDISETKLLQYGTHTVWMKSKSGSDIAGVAFVIDPGQTTYNSDEQLDSGSFNTKIIPIRSAAGGLSNQNGVDKITNTFANTPLISEPAMICLRSGGSEQSGLITIGVGGSNSISDLIVFNDPYCGEPTYLPVPPESELDVIPPSGTPDPSGEIPVGGPGVTVETPVVDPGPTTPPVRGSEGPSPPTKEITEKVTPAEPDVEKCVWSWMWNWLCGDGTEWWWPFWK